MNDNEKLTQRHKEILRFVLFIKLFDLQYPTFYKEVKGKFKQQVNIFSNHLHKLLAVFDNPANQEVVEYLDNTSAIAWEVLDELDKAKDKQMFLVMCQLFNQGLIVDEATALPTNETEFKDMLKAKAA
jgi:hypothetical protein